ncbi:MAG: hypothetical protein AB1510_00750 [Bacillota bacterium]
MIWKRSKWRMCVAVILSLLMLLTPTLAGYAASEFLGQTNSLSYQELNGPELDQLAQKTIDNEGVQRLVEHLAGKEAYLAGKRAAKWQFDGHEGDFVLLNYKGKEDVQIIFGESGGKVKVGAGVFKVTDKKIQIEAYDLVDGKTYHSSTITFLKDVNGKFGQPSVKWHSSPLMKNPKTIGSPPDISVAATNCDICKNICYYIYAGGCGVSSYLVCNGACIPFGTWTCPIICGIVWGIICLYGGGTSCPTLCQIAGFCP